MTQEEKIMGHLINEDTLISEIERLQDSIKATAINGRINKEQAEAYRVCVKLRSFVEDSIDAEKTNSEKELVEEIYSHIDSIKDTADRMTCGNFMHQILCTLYGD